MNSEVNHGTLLVVDDEPFIVQAIETLLRGHTDRIFTANNSKDAMEILDNNVVHCVVCDIKMPKMSGLEFIKEVREKKFNVPFIFITGYGTVTNVVEAFKHGAIDFVYKPKLDNIRKIIRRGLRIGLVTVAGLPIDESDGNETKQRILDLKKLKREEEGEF